MPVREERFAEVLDLFYEAAGLPELWPAALESLAEACGAGGAAVNSTLEGSGRPVCSPSMDEALHQHIVEGWQERNLRLDRGVRLFQRGHIGLIVEQYLFTPEEWVADPMLNDLSLPHGFSSFGGMVLAQAGSDVLPISLERNTADGPYQAADIASINKLLAKLQPAGALALRVGLSAATAVGHAMARPGEAVLLVGQSGSILRGHEPLDRSFADVVRVSSGRLTCVSAEADRMLQAAIARAIARVPIADRPQGRVALPRRDGRAPAMATIIPLTRSAQDVYMLARAIVILSSAESDNPPGEMTRDLMKLFHLTAAEARLAARLGTGESLRDIADAENITFETARSRLKEVFAKTGAGRQAELMVMIMRLMRH